MREQDCISEALAMARAFVRIGVKRFGLTRTDIAGKLVENGYRVGLNEGAMQLSLPYLVPLCWRLSQNLIVRPQEPAGWAFAQLDDLEAGKVERVRSRALLIVETSPGNFQVWLAIEGGDKALMQRLKKGIGSDSRASGAGRLAGSPNCKPKYAPNFPAVRIVDEPDATVKPGELADVLACVPKPVFTEQRQQHFSGGGSGRWPDYQDSLNHALLKSDGTPDRSMADCLWCRWALGRGNNRDTVEVKLREVSEKAGEEWDRGNEQYVSRTVDAALKRVR